MHVNSKNGKKLLTKTFTNTDTSKLILNPDLYP